ncbi:hypothetical protein OHV05_37105 (plasmid) [Kitasatospora sp. NBC_00070]|uniref:hypothetical protein n=1 Tax=Kitasatospora sp. NBC_00070 TaxID=2975962 RepID=UPI00324A6122
MTGHQAARAAYLGAGLVLGAVWVASGGVSWWLHLVRCAVLVTVGPALFQLFRRWRARHRPSGARQLRVAPMVVAKTVLVVAGVAADAALGPVVERPELVTGTVLGLLVAAAGPAFHRRAVLRKA